jgi:hypothetical protein
MPRVEIQRFVSLPFDVTGMGHAMCSVCQFNWTPIERAAIPASLLVPSGVSALVICGRGRIQSVRLHESVANPRRQHVCGLPSAKEEFFYDSTRRLPHSRVSKNVSFAAVIVLVVIRRWFCIIIYKCVRLLLFAVVVRVRTVRKLAGSYFPNRIPLNVSYPWKT